VGGGLTPTTRAQIKKKKPTRFSKGKDSKTNRKERVSSQRPSGKSTTKGDDEQENGWKEKSSEKFLGESSSDEREVLLGTNTETHPKKLSPILPGFVGKMQRPFGGHHGGRVPKKIKKTEGATLKKRVGLLQQGNRCWDPKPGLYCGGREKFQIKLNKPKGRARGDSGGGKKHEEKPQAKITKSYNWGTFSERK